MGARIGMTWLVATFGLAAIIAGVVGSIFGPAGSTANDIGLGAIGLGVVAVAAWLFRGRYRRPIWRAVLESLPAFGRLPMPVLALLAGLCLLAAIGGIVGDPASTDRTSSYSDLALTTATAVILFEWSVIFAWAVVLRRTHKPSAGYERQVQGGE